MSRKTGTEGYDERYAGLDSWPLERTLGELIDSNARAVEAVRAALPQLEAAAQAIAGQLESGGRLVYAGAGTSGRLALMDAAELPPTFGFDRAQVLLAGGSGAGESAMEGAEDNTQAAQHAVDDAQIGERDVLIGVAASGRTPYTVAALQAAGRRGAVTVGIANNPGTAVLEAARYPVLLDTGPEVLAGSTRLAAGTAQKVALNSLSTAVLVRLGGAYGNAMVGMALSNSKLRERAAGMIARATGCDLERARVALEGANGSIKVAIVSELLGVPAREALELLERSGGRVRDALQLDPS